MGLAACLSKAKKQARLVERKVGFISDVDYWGREVVVHKSIDQKFG